MIEEAAERYADGFASADELAALARRRLEARMRRSGTRRCAVCGLPLIGRDERTVTCSGRCRIAKYRQEHGA